MLNAEAFLSINLVCERHYERNFTRLMMIIDSRERIQFSAFISNMNSFMAVLFNPCKVIYLLAQDLMD